MTVRSKLASDGFGATQDRHPSYIMPTFTPAPDALAAVLKDDEAFFKRNAGAVRRRRPYEPGEFGDIEAEPLSIVIVALLDGAGGRVRTLIEPNRLKRAGVTFNDRPAKQAKAVEA